MSKLFPEYGHLSMFSGALCPKNEIKSSLSVRGQILHFDFDQKLETEIEA